MGVGFGVDLHVYVYVLAYANNLGGRMLVPAPMVKNMYKVINTLVFFLGRHGLQEACAWVRPTPSHFQPPQQ